MQVGKALEGGEKGRERRKTGLSMSNRSTSVFGYQDRGEPGESRSVRGKALEGRALT